MLVEPPVLHWPTSSETCGIAFLIRLVAVACQHDGSVSDARFRSRCPFSMTFLVLAYREPSKVGLGARCRNPAVRAWPPWHSAGVIGKGRVSKGDTPVLYLPSSLFSSFLSSRVSTSHAPDGLAPQCGNETDHPLRNRPFPRIDETWAGQYCGGSEARDPTWEHTTARARDPPHKRSAYRPFHRCTAQTYVAGCAPELGKCIASGWMGIFHWALDRTSIT
ncbi:hypothetical protein VTK73DRAFT_246 [Phialemonium thermophilum]|uniref:Uncharacterized protein n=1 Tax=Phialemonium thermophilum TaxID=223376 RepID=A0ABR3VW71_9PEZI